MGPETSTRAGAVTALTRTVVRQANDLLTRATDLRTTPAKLYAWLAGLLALGLLSVLVAATGSSDRATAVESVRTRTGPLTVAAQELYRSLSDADATAASAFLGGGVEPAALRQRYQDDIAAASAAVAKLAAGGNAGSTALTNLSTGLPVYTGLVEAARANNRIGAPLGAAYLREASGLMRGQLLPAAQTLYREQTRALADDTGAGSSFPWLAVPLLLILIGALLYAQRFLFQRTRRLINIGLAASTGAAALALLWLMIASGVGSGNLDDAQRKGSTQVQALAQLRIAALQARADEALTLVARGNGASFEKDYQSTLDTMVGKSGDTGAIVALIDDAPDDASRDRLTDIRDQVKAWRQAHEALRELDDGGKYPEAVAAAIGTAKTSTANQFSAIDQSIADGIASASRSFENDASDAAAAGSVTTGSLILLHLIILAGVVVGFQQRLAEYR